MFSRLRELIIQEVPEELSACVFECPATKCTFTIWSGCTLRSKGLPVRNGTARYNVIPELTEKPIRVSAGKELLSYS